MERCGVLETAASWPGKCVVAMLSVPLSPQSVSEFNNVH